ncbi:methyltransferase [Candidatus Woesearchaeota archaeon]|nr:methyltransferase [Candidatus Woesearchaeota archaeon]
MSIRSKKDLAVILGRLKGFSEPSWELEQYATPSEIAADWLWQAALKGDLAGKVILDAASGPGILGVGALLMGAQKVFFVDKSKEAMDICRENYASIEGDYEIGSGEFIVGNISIFDSEIDTVLENPPFGTKEKHVDKLFLEKAFEVSMVVWSMHKTVTKVFVEAICKDHDFTITDRFDYLFPIKAAFKWHEKPVKNVEVSLWRMEKKVL